MPDDADIDAWLTGGGSNKVRNLSEVTDLEQVKPAGERELRQHMIRAGELRPSNPQINEQSYLNKNTQGGVPLDTQSGMPAGLRMDLAWLREMPDKVRALQHRYPGLVRMSTDNVPIVRVTDPDGSQRDVLVDERRASLRDLVDVVGILPELAGSFVGLKSGRVAPGLRGLAGKAGVVRDMITTAGGAATAGALTDIAARRGHDLDVDLSEILEARSKGMLVDIGVDAATLGAGKALGTAFDVASGRTAPLMRNQGPVQRDAIEAVERIEQKTGIKIDLSAAEQTGSPGLARIETFAEAAGARGPAMRQRMAKEDKLREVQSFMLGTDKAPLPTSEQVGKDALGMLEDKAKTLTKATRAAEGDTISTATDEVLKLMDQASLPERALLKRDIGKVVREKIVKERSAFESKATELYEKTYEIPGGRDRIFELPSLAKRAEESLNALPPKTKTVEVIDYDAYGGPVAKTVEGKDVDKEFVPENVVGKLRSLAANPNEKRSLKDLVAMRTEVRNDIKRGEAIRGVQTHHLGKIHDMLTDAIEEAAGEMPTPELKDAWQAANKHYRDNVGRFRERGIAELFREGDVPGSVGDAQLVGRILGNSEQANDRYFVMKGFLGDSSREWKMLKRAMMDDLYEGSLDSVAGRTLDGATFLKKLDGLDREVRKDLLGGKESQLRSALNVLGVVQGKVPVEAVQKLLDSKMPSVGILNTAILAEAKKSKEFKKSIMKMVTSGDIVEAQIKPDEFVDRFVDLAGRDEIEEAMAMLSHNPKLVESIQRKTLERVFQKARRSPSAIDIAKGLEQDPTMMVSGKSILDAMGKTPDERLKLKAVIGDESYNMLSDYASVTAAQMERDRLGGMAGSLAQGGVINNIIQKGLSTATLEAIAKYRLVQWMVTNKGVRAWTNRSYNPSDWSDLATAAIVSTPFLEAMVEDSTSDGALYRMLKGLKTAAGLEKSDGDAPMPASENQIDQWLQQRQSP